MLPWPPWLQFRLSLAFVPPYSDSDGDEDGEHSQDCDDVDDDGDALIVTRTIEGEYPSESGDDHPTFPNPDREPADPDVTAIVQTDNSVRFEGGEGGTITSDATLDLEDWR